MLAHLIIIVTMFLNVKLSQKNMITEFDSTIYIAIKDFNYGGVILLSILWRFLRKQFYLKCNR